MNRTPMKQHVFDAANGTAAVSFVTAVVNGWSVSQWAAFAALVYSCILIVDKIASMVRRFNAWRKARNNG
jgi:uncharacterized membrane protein YcjF (UPF0283 family)